MSMPGYLRASSREEAQRLASAMRHQETGAKMSRIARSYLTGPVEYRDPSRARWYQQEAAFEYERAREQMEVS